MGVNLAINPLTPALTGRLEEIMSPNRVEIIGKKKIEEYYWAGRYVVYVNNQLTTETFAQACKLAKENLQDGPECPRC